MQCYDASYLYVLKAHLFSLSKKNEEDEGQNPVYWQGLVYHSQGYHYHFIFPDGSYVNDCIQM